ncbi:MAG: nitrous oxide reductase accessory protein NosL [Sulfurimonas sp.]|nr:nitrous oxide reductase accessory protein NosL [Sulfurimonas sp.]MDD3060718.1 nitrous oxide reductase accessory protein NosL [Sulfurimonas sp.]MDD5202385.1 nitrous oxide reductase accessory protein NosL [Sulfurimonas sp.]
MVSLQSLFFVTFVTFTTLFAAEPSEAVKIKKIYPMGEKIYTQKCQEINPNSYATLHELKNAIQTNALCSLQNETHINAVTLYLWDIKRVATVGETLPEIIVHKEDKCPICGMYVYKYPRWAAQIFFKDKTHHSFDGMKDLMKFYFGDTKKENIEMILVRDYYSQKSINAKSAFYVLGSDIYGPMGEELIAFANEEEAKNFSKDHKGKKLLHFKELHKEEVYKLDE